MKKAVVLILLALSTGGAVTNKRYSVTMSDKEFKFVVDPIWAATPLEAEQKAGSMVGPYLSPYGITQLVNHAKIEVRTGNQRTWVNAR